jgi:hypothetical protein
MEPNPLAIFGLCLVGAGGLVFLLWLNHKWATRGSARNERASIMASAASALPANSVPKVVHVPVAATGTGAPGTEGTDRDLPDTTAAEGGTDPWEAPPVSRYLTDREFTIFLIMQRRPDGKYRLSANAIHKAVGGSREEVLRMVREIREPQPEYHPLTPEQQQLRESLSLE